MNKVAEFLNTRSYRQALARLCRLAQEPVPDGRRALHDWENDLAKKPLLKPENRLIERLDTDLPKAIIQSDIENDPLLWLQAIDEHCHCIFAPDSTASHDTIDDGFGKSKVIRLQPGFGGGRLSAQFGNLSYWLKHHRVIPLDNVHCIPVDVCDIPTGCKDWVASLFETEAIKIGIVHFADDISLDIGYTDNHFFICNGIEDEEQRLVTALEHIRKAHEAGVHLLIMPELTITANMRATISELMMHLSLTEGDHHELSVPVIVRCQMEEPRRSALRT